MKHRFVLSNDDVGDIESVQIHIDTEVSDDIAFSMYRQYAIKYCKLNPMFISVKYGIVVVKEFTQKDIAIFNIYSIGSYDIEGENEVIWLGQDNENKFNCNDIATQNKWFSYFENVRNQSQM